MSSAQEQHPGSTGRDLRLWLPEIPFVPLLSTYELTDRELGRGGFGVVIAGRKRRLPQQVAIKRIHAEFEFSEVHQRRFVREVNLLAPLKHSNIVQIEDWGRDELGLYIVMELVEGPNLEDLVKQTGALPIDQILEFARQICKALQAAHSKEIVHRDLKPANLLLSPDGIIKLADFGLAREASDNRESYWVTIKAAGRKPSGNASPAAPLCVLGVTGSLAPYRSYWVIIKAAGREPNATWFSS
jgi:serine/threonine protein kinase